MNLQYALLFIGIVIVVIVALSAYDQSRARRARPRPEPTLGDFPRPEASVRPSLLEATRDESGEKMLRTDITVEPSPKPREEILRREIRQLEEVATMPLDLTAQLRPESRPRAVPGREYVWDEKIDFVIQLPGEQPVARDAALGIFKQHEYKLNKARHLYGRHHGTAHWSELQLDRGSTRYDDLALAIQLVDPRGPVDESELTAFTDIGLRLADALQRPTKLPRSFEEGLERAKELQTFCDTYDVIAGIHVVSGEAKFAGPAVRAAITQAGLVPGMLNLFHMKNEVAPGSRHLFSLADLDTARGFDPVAWERLETSGLTLFMSVPCAFQPGTVFDRMAATARGLAEALGGQLQDQNRRPLTDKGLGVIRHQIEDIEEKMRAFGIPPGSDTALKLFNEATSP